MGEGDIGGANAYITGKQGLLFEMGNPPLLMLFDDTFYTILYPAEGEISDRGSKFMAYAYPVRTETEVRTQLDALRKQHPKANHHCYAWRLGLDPNHYRANDDGEPAGTAGRPILNTILSRGLTNVLVVVVRYFGGKLLGVPGLINAYKQATGLALGAAPVSEQTLWEPYAIRFPFEATHAVMQVVKEHHLRVRKQDFDATNVLEVELRFSMRERILNQLRKIPGVETRLTEWV
jgi:uncharacterized YigZ family protein